MVGKTFESVADTAEKWYGTSYKLEKIAEEDLNKWKNAGLLDKFHLPPKNEFIPEQLDLVPREEVTKETIIEFGLLIIIILLQTSSLPVTLKTTKLSRVWYKQDEEFLLPKAILYIEIFR